MPSELNNTETTLDLLLTRRSQVAIKMTSPGPDQDQLKKIISAGLRVPDHGRAEPWRVQVLEEEGRKPLAELQERIFLSERQQDNPNKLAALIQITRNVPVILVVTSQPNPEKFEKVPLIEQQLSGGALCQNLLLAAHAMGFVAQWITGWSAYDARIKALLGHSADTDILGFIYIGNTQDPPSERPRPVYSDIVSSWPETT